MARWTKVPALTRKSQKILMPAIFTLDPGKTHMKIGTCLTGRPVLLELINYLPSCPGPLD